MYDAGLLLGAEIRLPNSGDIASNMVSRLW